jgi:hypothetical protein
MHYSRASNTRIEAKWVITKGQDTTNRTSNRSVETSLTLKIQFYSHLLEYSTTLLACTGANWQQYNQATSYCRIWHT